MINGTPMTDREFWAHFEGRHDMAIIDGLLDLMLVEAHLLAEQTDTIPPAMPIYEEDLT